MKTCQWDERDVGLYYLERPRRDDVRRQFIFWFILADSGLL